jgi:hypothetical protein
MEAVRDGGFDVKAAFEFDLDFLNQGVVFYEKGLEHRISIIPNANVPKKRGISMQWENLCCVIAPSWVSGDGMLCRREGSIHRLRRRCNIIEEVQVRNIRKNAVKVGVLNKLGEPLLFLFTKRVGEF